jgi:hypothetical protein
MERQDQVLKGERIVARHGQAPWRMRRAKSSIHAAAQHCLIQKRQHLKVMSGIDSNM